MLVRQCVQCGKADANRRWSSLEDASKDGAAGSGWACPNCAWTEAELVEMSDMPDPARKPADPARDQAEPYAPVDPDEAKRALSGMHPR